jgi:hypothetical protein
MDGCRLSHFEGSVEKKNTGHIYWNNNYLEHKEGRISYEPETQARPAKKREIGTALSPVFGAIFIKFLFSPSFQKNLCDRAVLVTENRRTAMSISQESQYMTFLIRETPLRRT